MSKVADIFDDICGPNAVDQAVSHFIDTGFPPLNKCVSGRYDGGLPMGRIVEMYGPSSSGKTLIATAAMISAQRQGGVAIFMDHERSFDVSLAQRMGLTVERPSWFYLRPNTWEESNAKAMQLGERIREKKIIPDEAPILVVFDSVAAMVPQSVFDKGIDEYSMNDTTALARVTSTTLKVVKMVVAENHMTALYLNQIRTKPGVAYGDPTTTPGGSSMEFFADARIALGKRIVKEGKEQVGQEITAKVVKSKMTRPNQTTAWRMNYLDDGGVALDVVGSLVDHMTEANILPTSGTWIEYDGKKYQRKVLVEKINNEALLPDLLSKLPT